MGARLEVGSSGDDQLCNMGVGMCARSQRAAIKNSHMGREGSNP